MLSGSKVMRSIMVRTLYNTGAILVAIANQRKACIVWKKYAVQLFGDFREIIDYD